MIMDAASSVWCARLSIGGDPVVVQPVDGYVLHVTDVRFVDNSDNNGTSVLRMTTIDEDENENTSTLCCLNPKKITEFKPNLLLGSDSATTFLVTGVKGTRGTVQLTGRYQPAQQQSESGDKDIVPPADQEQACTPRRPPDHIEKLVEALQRPSLLIDWQDSMLGDNALVQNVFQACRQKQIMPLSFVQSLVEASKHVLKQERNVIRIQVPESGRLVLCGDTHGQLNNFCEILSDTIGGMPSTTNHYLFNGDIVDRGDNALEILIVLLTMKLVRPDVVHILRGNHETRYLTEHFGFKTEVLKKYHSLALYNEFMKLFDALPIAATIDGDIFVVHGGLSIDNFRLTLDDIDRLHRFQETSGVIDDFLWKDPDDTLEFFGPRQATSGRVGDAFGKEATKAFLNLNHLSLLVRSHQMMEDGYGIMHDGLCVTIFSASNYRQPRLANFGAVMCIEHGTAPPEEGWRVAGKLRYTFVQFRVEE